MFLRLKGDHSPSPALISNGHLDDPIGITNLAFSRNSNGTPVHSVFGFGGDSHIQQPDGSVRSGSYRLVTTPTAAVVSTDQLPERHSSAASSSTPSESAGSSHQMLYRHGDGNSAAGDEQQQAGQYQVDEEPVRYSTAVQTTAPSTTASLRLARPRNVSLV